MAGHKKLLCSSLMADAEEKIEILADAKSTNSYFLGPTFLSLPVLQKAFIMLENMFEKALKKKKGQKWQMSDNTKFDTDAVFLLTNLSSLFFAEYCKPQIF